MTITIDLSNPAVLVVGCLGWLIVVGGAFLSGVASGTGDDGEGIAGFGVFAILLSLGASVIGVAVSVGRLVWERI